MKRPDWDTYKNNFVKEAFETGYSEGEITELLNYAKILYDNNIPIIYDQTHLSLLVGYRISFLRKVTNSQSKFYRVFKIPKKAGGERTIAEPLPSLKEIQRWILDNILVEAPVSKHAKAYISNRSIKSNASYHVGKKLVLRLDMTNFFGSIKFKRVYGVFSSLGYNTQVAAMLSELCILSNSLPQGAPTSPAISNIIMFQADKRIANLAKKHKINYTRYADDMTFSGEFEPGMIIKFVKTVLKDYKLELNPKKTRAQKKHQRQLVTGIVVNEKMQAPRDMRRKLRQSVYYIEKYGLDSHLEKTSNKRANHIFRDCQKKCVNELS
jgi:RNA-directed DNA polymerase